MSAGMTCHEVGAGQCSFGGLGMEQGKAREDQDETIRAECRLPVLSGTFYT